MRIYIFGILFLIAQNSFSQGPEIKCKVSRDALLMKFDTINTILYSDFLQKDYFNLRLIIGEKEYPIFAFTLFVQAPKGDPREFTYDFKKYKEGIADAHLYSPFLKVDKLYLSNFKYQIGDKIREIKTKQLIFYFK